MSNTSQQQPYDNILKRILEACPGEIIPRLLDEGDIEIREILEINIHQELNVELLIPPRRVDRVYRGTYKGNRIFSTLKSRQPGVSGGAQRPNACSSTIAYCSRNTTCR